MTTYTLHNPAPIKREYVINNYIEKFGLYNVYMRQEEPIINNRDCAVHLIASFATYSRAELWVKENGSQHVKKQEDNYSTPIVLTIIHQKNCDQSDHDYCDGYTSSDKISVKQYPTFAFSKVKIEYTPQLSDGKPDATEVLTWDIAGNKEG